jgi:serine/threonine-protein kinase RsbW
VYQPAVSAHPLAEEALGRLDLDVTVPAELRHIRLLRETARSFAVNRGVPRPEDVRLAVSEACANVVLHAYEGADPGPLRLHGTSEPGSVTFTIEDRGVGLHPMIDGGGLGIGIALISGVSDHYMIGSHPQGGTRVEMTFATRLVSAA